MTTFTRLLINPAKRGGRKLLTNPQAMHAAVMATLAPDHSSTGRILWRVDHSGHEHALYIVSPEQPEVEHIVEQAGWRSSPPRFADYDRLLNRLTRGQEWAFRLRANPVKSQRSPEGRGKVLPHVTAHQQADWLAKIAPSRGFEIPVEKLEDDAIALVQVTERSDLQFNRADRANGTKNRVTLRTAQFDGTLRVTDVEKLRHSLVNGIGRGKAYGCGLLTLRPISG